jgi:ATP dependent DNA ligase-like protein
MSGSGLAQADPRVAKSMETLSTSVKILTFCSAVHFRRRSTREMISPNLSISVPTHVLKDTKAHDLPQPRKAAVSRRLLPTESQLMFLVFDLLHQDGVDLRGLPLSERKRDLDRLCRKSKVPFLKQVQTFPDGGVLFEHCNKFGFEGVVSKRLSSRYMSGPSRNWTKSKCPDWKRDNTERYRLFEPPKNGGGSLPEAP